MQPRIKAKVTCTDREVGEVIRVIVDPLTRQISHLVVAMGGRELLVPADGTLASVTEESIRLNCSSDALGEFEPFRRADYLSIDEVEIPHLERHLDVMPGEVLVPLPELEKDLSRRSFFTKFTNVIGAALALPLVFPVVKYLIKPMYQPFNNHWFKLGNVSQSTQEDVPRLIKFEKTVREGYLERKFEKSHWVIKPSEAVRKKIVDEPVEHDFRDSSGRIIWENDPDSAVFVFSGKCTHLGCAYRWRFHRKFGHAFICPCHLSVFDLSGKVLDGPAPRPLDQLPVRITDAGGIEIIDMEFKAGRAEQIRIV